MTPTSPGHTVCERHAPAALLHGFIDPVVACGTLIGCKLAAEAPLTGADLILSVLVFSLTYPGSTPYPHRPGHLVRNALASWSLVVIVLLAIGWSTGTLGHYDIRVILAWAIATPVLIAVSKLSLVRVLTSERTQRRAVIAGEGELGQRLAARLRGAPDCGVRFVGYFDDRALARSPGVKAEENLGRLDALASYVQRHRIDIIYITLPMTSQPRLLRLLDELRDTTASIYFVPDMFVFDLIQARTDTVNGMLVIAVCESPFYGINGAIKFAFDIAFATTILALISPLLLAIAIGVKLTSPGPVLFRQRRYGLDGREIVVYKFRTMRVQEDGAVVRQATRNDSRVTRFGAFLRCTSLDELPQFINVLQGRMSVVGPRPHAVAHNELYRKLIPGYMIRHKVRPGITGLAQVRGLRGETDTIDKMRGRIACDLEYLRNWSPLLDLEIVVRTIPAALFNRNAY